MTKPHCPDRLIDIMYMQGTRSAYIETTLPALLAHTNWALVRSLHIFQDTSREYTPLPLGISNGQGTRVYQHFDDYRGPNLALAAFIDLTADAHLIVKLDDDAYVPPGWLGATLQAYQSGTLLGLEPFEGWDLIPCSQGRHSLPTQNNRPIGGLFMAQRALFEGRPLNCEAHALKPVDYYSWADWQLRYPEVPRRWMVPGIPLCLLDRIPDEPWSSLARSYYAMGIQRRWTLYTHEDQELWLDIQLPEEIA